MPLPPCSISRPVEEAANDVPWPGPPVRHLTQTKLAFVRKPPPAEAKRRAQTQNAERFAGR